MKSCPDPLSRRPHSITDTQENTAVLPRNVQKNEPDIDKSTTQNITHLITLFSIQKEYDNSRNTQTPFKKELSQSSDGIKENKASRAAKQILCQEKPTDLIPSDLMSPGPLSIHFIEQTDFQSKRLIRPSKTNREEIIFLLKEIKKHLKVLPSVLSEIKPTEESKKEIFKLHNFSITLQDFANLPILNRIFTRLRYLEVFLDNFLEKSKLHIDLLNVLGHLKHNINLYSNEPNSHSFNISTFLFNLVTLENSVLQGKVEKDILRCVYIGIHGNDKPLKELKTYLERIADFSKNPTEALKCFKKNAVQSDYYSIKVREDMFRCLFGSTDKPDHRDIHSEVPFKAIDINDELIPLDQLRGNRKEYQQRFFSIFLETLIRSTPTISPLFNNKENLTVGDFLTDDLQQYIEQYILERKFIFPNIDKLFQHHSAFWRIRGHQNITETFPDLVINFKELTIKEVKNNLRISFCTRDPNFFRCRQIFSFNIHPLLFPFDKEKHQHNTDLILGTITFCWEGTYYYKSKKLKPKLSIDNIEFSDGITDKFKEVIFRALTLVGMPYEDERKINETKIEWIPESRNGSKPIPISQKEKSKHILHRRPFIKKPRE